VELSGIEALAALAERQSRNGGPPEDARILPPPSAPLAVARQLVAERFMSPDGVLLRRRWRGQWWEWQTAHWAEIELGAIAKSAYEYTEGCWYVDGKQLKEWHPTRRKIADLLDAAAAVCHLGRQVDQPCWLGGDYDGTVVSCSNGLLDVERRLLIEHDPCFFNLVSVPFAFDPDARDPGRWLAFLDSLWGEDIEQIKALAEWFGYVLSGRTDLHKILLLVGPTRAGKGVISRTLAKLIGPKNVAGPTLSSLRTNFGLAPLIGRPLAIVSDARLDGQDSSAVVERLLSVSGEDLLTVDIKYAQQWCGRLPTRFMICSNELPRLTDASGAIAARFVPLILEKSWLHEEDVDLERDLEPELPSILNWGLGGLERLERQERFTRPSEAAIIQLQDLASPIRAFLRDCAELRADGETKVDDLWVAWRTWCDDNGHAKGNKQLLGRNLKSAAPQVRVHRVGPTGGQQRSYSGIALREPPL
jgi:putative DNA primase/helicase